MRKNIIPFVIILIVIPAIFVLSIRLQKASEVNLVNRYTGQQTLVAREVSYSIERFLSDIERDLSLANFVYSGSMRDSDKNLYFISRHFNEISNLCGIFLYSEGKEVSFFPKDDSCSLIDRKKLVNAIKLSMEGKGQVFTALSGTKNKCMIVLPASVYNSTEETGKYNRNMPGENILGCVIDVTRLAEYFAEPLKISKRSYAWIIDSEGNLVHHPYHKEMEGRNIIKNSGGCIDCHINRFETEKIMLSGKSGVAKYGIKGEEEKLVVYYPINLTGSKSLQQTGNSSWAIAISVPYSDVTSYISFVNRNIIILSGASIVLIFFVALYTIVINAKRVRIEEMMKWSRQMIETKNRLETLFDGITDGISIIDKDYRIITMNKAMEEMMGVTGVMYESDFCYKQFARRDSICETCPVKETLTSGKLHHMEREFKDDDGNIIHWMIYTYPIRDADGDVFQVIKYVRDVTEQKRISEELEHSKRLSAIGEMIAAIAHEIKNPLQNVSMGISLLKDDFESNSENRKTIEGVGEGVKKLSTIVSDLLDFSKPLNIEVFDYNINEVIDEVTNEFLTDFSIRGIKFEKSYQQENGNEPLIKLDAFKIKQVFSNLFQNAAEAMTTGGKINITTNFVRDKERKKVTVKVRDSGVGIKRENISKIFDPFFTTKSKGVGLGMAIVKRIIELHKGMISVESKEGSWTEFTIVFVDEEHYV